MARDDAERLNQVPLCNVADQRMPTDPRAHRGTVVGGVAVKRNKVGKAGDGVLAEQDGEAAVADLDGFRRAHGEGGGHGPPPEFCIT